MIKETEVIYHFGITFTDIKTIIKEALNDSYDTLSTLIEDIDAHYENGISSIVLRSDIDSEILLVGEEFNYAIKIADLKANIRKTGEVPLFFNLYEQSVLQNDDRYINLDLLVHDFKDYEEYKLVLGRIEDFISDECGFGVEEKLNIILKVQLTSVNA